MSVSCTKCNATVADGAQFCPACGTPVGAPATPPPPASGYSPVSYSGQAAAPPPPAYSGVGVPMAQPPAPPKSNAVKVILIIVAIVVGLGLVGVAGFGYVVWRVGHAIRANSSTGEVTFNTPGGTFKAGGTQKYTAEELGTDIYPGATNAKGGMKMQTPSGSIITGVFVTSDSKDTVLDFYKSKFGAEASVYDTANGSVLTLKKGEQESVMVTISSRESENDGKTKIVIVHTTNTKTS